ncbi:hypothetical protein M8494_09830 [Serratia ureilytica]
MISGRPGLPGINPYLGNDAHVARLRKSYDIIGYDPRGVGQSTPKIFCQLAEGDETPSPDDNDVAGAESQTRTLDCRLYQTDRRGRRNIMAPTKRSTI